MFCRLFILTALTISQSTEAQLQNRIEEPGGAAALLRGALAKQSAGDYATAHTMLTNALLAAPKSGRLLSALGSVQQDLGEYLEAERSYIRALEIFAQSGNDLPRDRRSK
jgi:Tfp pilus assembly protein PilF